MIRGWKRKKALRDGMTMKREMREFDKFLRHDRQGLMANGYVGLGDRELEIMWLH